MDQSQDFYIGDIRVEPSLHRMVRDGQVRRLTPKAVQVLLCLAARQGEVVTRQHLLEEVWPESEVNEEVLTRAVADLRKALGETASASRLIETIPKRGYRLAATVRRAEAAAVGEAAGRPARGEQPGDEGPSGLSPEPAPRRKLSVVRVGLWIFPAAVALAVVGAVLGTLYWSDGGQALDPLPLRTRPLTSMPGREALPSFSPDGNQVAFSHRSPGDGSTWDLYVQMADGEGRLQLTQGVGHDVAAVWSPDARRILFMRYQRQDCAILSVSALGGDPVALGDCGESQSADLALSPDGRWLAFSDRPAEGESFAIRLLSTDGAQSRFLQGTGDQPKQQTWGDKDPSFSPDGRWLAFTRSVSMRTQDVFLAPLEGGPAKRLTFDAAAVSGHVFTPHGKALIIASSRAGQGGLWRVDLQTLQPRWMPLDVSRPSFPDVSPDGQWVVLQNTRQEADIIRLGIEDGSVTPVVESTRDDIAPTAGPEGLLAYASDRGGSYEIYIRRNGNDRRLTSFGGPFAGSPRLSPDGRWVAYDARPYGHADIFLSEVGTGRQIRLTHADSNELSPTWSSDGRWVYFGSNRGGRWQVWKTAFQAGQAGPSSGGPDSRPPSSQWRRVTTQGGYSGFPSDDGEHLYFFKYDQMGLFSLHLDSGKETLLTSQIPGEGFVALCASGLCMLRSRESSVDLVRFQPGSGEEHVLQTFPRGPRGPIALSRDGRFLYAIRRSPGQSDLVAARLTPAPMP